MSRRRAFALWLAVLGPIVAGCSETAPHPAAGAVEEVAERAIAAVRDRDFETLARLAHPERGVRFSPYAYVRPESDVTLTAAELAVADRDRAVRLWGERDGSGEPIRMTVEEYWRHFVYDLDFAAAGETAWERRLGRGNSLDNRAEVYPGSRSVEYHVRGVDPELEGLDWRSLRLVFVPEGARWYLVAIIHDQWTI